MVFEQTHFVRNPDGCEGAARLRITDDDIGFFRFTADVGGKRGSHRKYPHHPEKNRSPQRHAFSSTSISQKYAQPETLFSKLDETGSEVLRSASLNSAVDVPFHSF